MKKVDISRSTYEKSLRELKKEGLITCVFSASLRNQGNEI